MTTWFSLFKSKEGGGGGAERGDIVHKKQTKVYFSFLFPFFHLPFQSYPLFLFPTPPRVFFCLTTFLLALFGGSLLFFFGMDSTKSPAEITRGIVAFSGDITILERLSCFPEVTVEGSFSPQGRIFVDYFVYLFF